MKSPFKKRTPKSSGRQRIRAEQPSGQSSYGYYARRSEEAITTGRQSPRDNPVAARTSERLRRFWLQRFGLVILFVVLVAASINSLLLSPNPKIVPLTTDSAVLRDQATYQAAAESILKETPANRTKLTINVEQVSRDMLKKFPELTSATVGLPLVAHRPVIYISGARPALIVSASSGSYVVSSAGKVLAPSAQLDSSVRNKLPTVTDQSGLELQVGSQVLTGSNVRFIETVNAQLAAKSYAVAAMTLPKAAGELDVQIAGQPYFVKFNTQSNTAREQVGTFLATMSQLQKDHAMPTKYVDVRVDGRAYYL